MVEKWLLSMLDRSEFLLRIHGGRRADSRPLTPHICASICVYTHTRAIKFLKKTLQMVICSVYELYMTLANTVVCLVP